MHEINLMDLGNIPVGLSYYFVALSSGCVKLILNSIRCQSSYFFPQDGEDLSPARHAFIILGSKIFTETLAALLQLRDDTQGLF